MKVLRAVICLVFLFACFAAVSAAEPSTVSVPEDVEITPPDSLLPQEVTAFFGKTGRWWGTWYGTPPGNMEAILIIKKIINSKMAEVLYIVPSYPTWGIKAARIERIARFEKKDGKIFLVIPSPVNTRFECVFDTGTLIGAIRGPHLSSDIVWESF